LGLAFGALIRRVSAIGLLAILGAGIYLTTRALNVELQITSPFWGNVGRGALIGLVLGYAYGYMLRTPQHERKSLPVNTRQAKIRIAFFVSIAIIAIAILTYKVRTGPLTYSNPMFGGYRLDWCYSAGIDCGEPAATEWCHRMGYSELVTFEEDAAVSERGIDTKVITSGQICHGSGGDYCDSFISITCRSP